MNDNYEQGQLATSKLCHEHQPNIDGEVWYDIECSECGDRFALLETELK